MKVVYIERVCRDCGLYWCLLRTWPVTNIGLLRTLACYEHWPVTNIGLLRTLACYEHCLLRTLSVMNMVGY